MYYICKLKGRSIKSFRTPIILFMQTVPCHPRLNRIFICLCKVPKSGTSRHRSSDFYLFSFIGFCCFCMASCYVCGNSHSIQFMCSICDHKHFFWKTYIQIETRELLVSFRKCTKNQATIDPSPPPLQ